MERQKEAKLKPIKRKPLKLNQRLKRKQVQCVMLFKTNKQKGSGSYKTKSDLSNMDSEEFPTHIFHTETRKTTNKQAQTKENSSGKALDYAEILAETCKAQKSRIAT